MQLQSLQQEIFLNANSKISRGQLAGAGSSEADQTLPYIEKLEAACRNGLLDKLLHDTINKLSSGKKLHLWQIKAGSRFLHIELCTFPVVIERQHSINPYRFLPTACAN